MRKKKKKNNEATVVTFLNRNQVDFLDKIGKDCFFKHGYKLSRSKILSELVQLLMNLGIDVEELDLNVESLREGLLRFIKNGCIL